MKINEKWKWGAGIVIGTYWLIIAILSTSSNIELKKYIIIGITTTIIGVTIMLNEYILAMSKKLKEKEKTPEPITEKKLKEMINTIIEENGNYIQKGTFIEKKSVPIEGNIIYYAKINLYREVEIDNEKTKKIVIIINRTFPEIYEVTPFKENREEMAEDIMEKIRIMSINWKNPDTQEIEETVDAYGKPVRKSKTTTFHKEEKKDEEDVA